MPARILYQRDNLTVDEEKITVGTATIFYPSISAMSIYEGRPFLWVGISGLVGALPVAFLIFMGSRLFGPYFHGGFMAVVLLPLAAMAVFGLTYQTKCLILGVAGGSIALLRNRHRWQLDEAKEAIEDAKHKFESKRG